MAPGKGVKTRIASKRVDVRAERAERGQYRFAMIAINMSARKLAGTDLIMLAGFVNSPRTGWSCGPKAIPPWNLNGKWIAIFRFGSAANRASRLILATFGLDPEKDVS